MQQHGNVRNGDGAAAAAQRVVRARRGRRGRRRAASSSSGRQPEPSTSGLGQLGQAKMDSDGYTPARRQAPRPCPGPAGSGLGRLGAAPGRPVQTHAAQSPRAPAR